MNRKIFAIFCVLFCLFPLFSCGNGDQQHGKSYATEQIPGGYTPGTDCQYFQMCENSPYPKVQETDMGCYFYHNKFVYYYDLENDKVMPLCTKNNCLHDRETSEEKRQECNAYLGRVMAEAAVMLYNGDLYVGYLYANQGDIPEGDYFFPYVLSKLKTDGSGKEEKFMVLSEDAEYRMIHRGYLYYYKVKESEPEPSDEDGREVRYGMNATLCRRSLEGSHKEEVLFGPMEKVSISMMRPYGDYLYFQMDSQIPEDNQTLSSYIYDIKKGTVSPANFTGNRITFNGEMYSIPLKYITHDYAVETKDLSNIVHTDYMGNEIDTAVHDVPQGCFMGADSRYLYVNNAILHYFDEEVELKCQVYDKEFKLVDEFTLPESNLPVLDFPVGGDQYRYRVFEDNKTGEWGLAVWDKSTIGKLKGKAFEERKVIAGTDPSLIEEDQEGGTSASGKEEGDPKADITYSEITDKYLCEESEWADTETDKKDYYPEAAYELNEDGEKVYFLQYHMDMTEKEIKAVAVCTDINPGWEEKTELTGYYLKEGKVYERKVTVTGAYTDEIQEIPAVLELPEDADRFIGAKADYLTFVMNESNTMAVLSSVADTSAGRISGK
ncbi:MAG: hypothetical protein IJL98_02235 [Lachnospiraceae bacterium]|nr:hypothetical protein [Lachnospiraceae bacterium]